MIRKLDVFNANNKAGKVKLYTDSIRSHCAILVLILKNKDLKCALKSYNGDKIVLLNKLGLLLTEMRTHKLAIKMEYIQDDLSLSSTASSTYSKKNDILPLNSEMIALTKAFNDGEYSHVDFTTLYDASERYLIKIERELNLA
ncbi:hypothetical protein LMH73_004780 [Vibrio splendidus]|nr:hypothetical protein [Vibrio splendidus]MCC4882544.1 hypothetical protein [Vibrio splendidus]